MLTFRNNSNECEHFITLKKEHFNIQNKIENDDFNDHIIYIENIDKRMEYVRNFPIITSIDNTQKI